MDYEAHYHALIERARKRSLSAYRERHHVVPRCMGGVDEFANIVELTPEEHYVAHQLLVKLYPDNIGLLAAANWMGKRSVGNKAYGWLRRRMSEARKGKPLSVEHKAKLSAAKKGRTLTQEHRQKIARAGIGRTVSAETRLKMRAIKIGKPARCGRIVSEETRNKISIARKGWVPSAQTRARISATKRGVAYVA